MRYFLTGATGFIGGVLARALRREGHEVVALVRDLAKAAPLAAAGITLVDGDVTDPASLREPMRGVDGVFHVAALYRLGIDRERVEATNVAGTRHVMEAARDLGVPRVVYTGTLGVYGDTGGRRVREGERPPRPTLSAYHETKWRAQYEVVDPFAAEGLPVVSVFPGLVYGLGDTSQLGAMLGRIAAGVPLPLPGGASGVCWGFVDDIVQGHVAAMERGVLGEHYHLAGPCHTYAEAVATMTRATGRRSRALLVPPAVLRGGAALAAFVERWARLPEDYAAESQRAVAGTTFYGDDTKARETLGFAPRSLEEGLRATFSDAPRQPMV
jgi:dihydroflavonol-4-reductase